MAASVFHTRQILAVDDAGYPTLEGTNAKLVMTTTFSAADVGHTAVCQNGVDDTPTIVVFGILDNDRDSSDDNAPLVLEKGASKLALYPDGRIRLNGIDVKVAADAVVSFDAARIDLN